MKKSCLFIILIIAITACSPSHQQLTATQVAQEIYGTQTAIAPTAMITFTPSLTSTAWQASTAIPTRSTSSPTATLNADGVERMFLCYKAAVVVHADMEVLLTIVHKSANTENTQMELYYFLQDRQSRVNSLFQEELPPGVDPNKVRPDLLEAFRESILVVNSIRLSDADCAGKYEVIVGTNDLIDFESKIYTSFSGGRIGSGADIALADQHIYSALETIYKVDPAKLDSIRIPIWQHVHNRYGVVIP